MRVIDVISKKRDGFELSTTEIYELVNRYSTGEIPDYQMSAWLMTVYFQGMSQRELADLTMSMATSGSIVDLSSVPGIKVDKHSTGGVADTTTLIIAPLVAAAGAIMAKMSGRGLGFTGGTIDKLESIPGFQTALSKEDFLFNLKQHGIALIGQTPEIAPADGKIYALRDATATIESIPLIAASIMSKKIAAGADKILLDVKVGNGAFMKTLEDAISLAETMVKIGQSVGRETMAIISNMQAPLGLAVGNSLEVVEAIDILSGRMNNDLRHVSLVIAAHLLVMAKIVSNMDEGYAKLEGLIENKAGLKKLSEFIASQGGDPDIVFHIDRLPAAQYVVEVKSHICGYIQEIDAKKIGVCASILGAGREWKDQQLDLSAGLIMRCRVGDWIDENAVIAILHTNKNEKIEEVQALLLTAVFITQEKVPKSKLILGIVNENGYIPM